jgi:hypothetical protein
MFFRRLLGYPVFRNVCPNFDIRDFGGEIEPEAIRETLETALLRIRERLSTISMQDVPQSLRGCLRNAVKALQKNRTIHFALLEGEGNGITVVEDKKFIVINREVLENTVHVELHDLDGSVHQRTMKSRDYLEHYILWGIMSIESGISTSPSSGKIEDDIGTAAYLAFPVRSERGVL